LLELRQTTTRSRKQHDVMMMMMILRVAGVSIDGDLFELVGER
jgi:hypothetical protein